MPRRSGLFGVVVLVLLLGLAVLGAGFPARAQEPYEAMKAGESVFAGATPTDLGSGAVPAYPALPAAIGLQRVAIAPGGRVETPGDDPRLVFFVVERGTLTVRSTAPAVVVRASGARETVPADTDFAMGPGDSTVSGPRSGGQLRNDGAGEAALLAAILWPVGAGTPAAAATPAP
jgi:hypothetical protein